MIKKTKYNQVKFIDMGRDSPFNVAARGARAVTVCEAVGQNMNQKAAHNE